MTQKLLFFILLFLPGKTIFAQLNRPKLVVGIVIDQMRWDYLYRYYHLYGNNGFKRLMREGFNCQETFLNYIPAYTAVGHASIYTGSVPAYNGIVANDWFNRISGKAVYCTEDTSVHAVGGSAKNGSMSPHNLLSTTITDELRLATHFKSRVIGLSLKDRAAILPAGHSANAAYWYDAPTGHFMTSSYYRQSLPKWLTAFNKRHLPDSLIRQNWRPLFPKSAYQASTADNNNYEGLLPGASKPVFPHKLSALPLQQRRKIIRYTPFGNTLLRMLAEDCIKNTDLGKDTTTDFLTLSFSATDYAGHLYGPDAMEVEDVYLRLDKQIAKLLTFLDKQIGKGNYLLFLTADHGADHNALFMKAHHIPAGTIAIRQMKSKLNRHLFQKYKDSSLVRSLYNFQVFLNNRKIAHHNINRQHLLQDIKNYLSQLPEVTAVYNLSNDDVNRAPEPLQTMIKNGYYRNRCGSLQIILNPQWYSHGTTATGTSHGSWNANSTHIPLLWYGWHIHKGESYRLIHITDIATTLAALLHIQMPNTSIGQVITEIMK